MDDVRFTVLGRVGVAVDGADVPVGGRRERAVLSLLLAARRRVVSVDRLVEDIWGAAPAATSHGSLQVAVSRLRAVTEPHRAPRAAPQLLVSRGSGYALLTPADSVDADRFAALVGEAHRALAAGDARAALAACERAGGLWTGVPFADVVGGEFVGAERARLEDLHTSALELRAEALLALGRHALVTGDLEVLVGQHPFRERLWQLYALALYRGGRQADALAVLRRARTVLREELGVDPSPALRRLESDVLAHAPDLAPAAEPVRAPDPVVAADPVTAAPASSTPPPAATLAPATRLVGRDQAVERLRAPLQAALGGAGQAAVVSGDAGIGKTRVAHEIARAATALGARVLWGRCHEADVSPAYWPWIPVVRELAGQHPAAPVAELLSPSPGGRGGGDADSAALRTFDAVVGVVAAAAAGGPLVVVLEDVHWADSASLRLLAYAAEALRDVPVLLLVTFRATREPGPALQACLAALGRLSAVRVPLGGLSGAHVRDLVRHLVGPDVTEELTDVVAERTDGNPFFVIELVRLLLAEHRLHATGARDVDVPDGVRDVLRLRLGRLPEPVGRLLGTAAVVGRDFSLDLLAAVAATDPDDVLDALDAAVAAHLVEEGHAPGRYRFTHALVRETLYGALSLVRRGRMHAAIAVAQEPALAGDPELVTELAHHFVLGAAVRPELAAPAVQHATAAAARAEARGALDQALGHWEQALSADALAPQTDLRRRHGVLLGLGRARYRRGDVVGSREALDAAVALGRSLADVELVAQAATSFRGAGVWHWREFGTSDPAMVAVLQECVASLPPGPLHARSLASLAMELVYEWRSEAADAVSTRAVEAARAVADADLLADVIGLRTLTLWGRPGAATQRLALAAEVLALPLSREQELYTRFGAAAAHLQLGEAAEADRQMTRCVELTRRLRHTGADVPIAWWFFYRAVARGDEDAERLGHQAIERHRRSSVVAIVDMEPMARLRLPGPDGGGSRVQEADVRLAAGHANPAFRAVVAHALACAGRAAEGVELLGPPVPEGAWDYASVYGDCLRVDVLAAAGRTDALPEALDRIAAWGHEFAVYGSTDCVGSIDYFVGRGLEALGDRDGAAAAYRRAADRNREAGVRRWQERAETRLAALDPQPAGPR